MEYRAPNLGLSVSVSGITCKPQFVAYQNSGSVYWSPYFIFMDGGHFLPECILALSSLVHGTLLHSFGSRCCSFRQNLSFHLHITLQLMIVSSLDLCLHYVLTPAPLIFSPLFFIAYPLSLLPFAHHGSGNYYGCP